MHGTCLIPEAFSSKAHHMAMQQPGELASFCVEEDEEEVPLLLKNVTPKLHLAGSAGGITWRQAAQEHWCAVHGQLIALLQP